MSNRIAVLTIFTFWAEIQIRPFNVHPLAQTRAFIAQNQRC
jgi:hypothetical protein